MANVKRIEMAYNNVYAIDLDDRQVVIDTGPDYAGAWEIVRERVGAKPDVVIATHGHHDHAGLGRAWQEAGVPVYLHPDDHHLAAGPWPGRDDVFAGMASSIRSSGAPADVQAEALAGIDRRREQGVRAATSAERPPAGNGNRWPTGLLYRPFEPDAEASRAAEAGVRVVHCPGHTPGNVVAVVDAEGWLFSGDQLLPNITPTPALQGLPPGANGRGWRFRSLPPFLDALRALEREQFTRCFPGHGEPFDNVTETLRANIALIEQRAERIRDLLRVHGPMSLYGICETLYPKAARKRFWQIAATVQGHLDVLERNEAIHLDDGRFVATP